MHDKRKFFWILDGASALVESSVGVDAMQTSGHRADAWIVLQAAHAAVRVEGVGERLSLLHVGVWGGEVMWDDHGYGVLQLLPAFVPKTGAHGLKVENLGVNITQAAARCSSAVPAGGVAPAAPGGGRRSRVHGAGDATACLALVGEKSPLLGIPLFVFWVHGHEAQHYQVEEGADHSQTHQDVNEAEDHVALLFLQRFSFLQCHIVSKTDSGQCDKAVVVGLKEGPSLKVRESQRPRT